MCRVSVEGDHRKRRKLHGLSCEIARTVLLTLSRFALHYSETKNPNAFLCVACDKLLRDLGNRDQVRAIAGKDCREARKIKEELKYL